MSDKILIIDDHLLVAETLGNFLKSVGYDVVFSTSISDARNTLAKEGGFDIVLLDLR